MTTRLDVIYERDTRQVRAKVVAFAARQWAALPSYRDQDAERLISLLLPRIEAGQKRVAQLTDSYFTRVSAAELGVKAVAGRVADVRTEAIRGVPAEIVYRRPFVTVYTELANGASVAGAIAQGANRLADLVQTGSQLAKTHAARGAMARTGIETFERTLTGRENCVLCIIASTQRYWRGDLMPIHPGCDCIPRPRRGNPNQQIINPERLESAHQAVVDMFGSTDRGARFLDGHHPVSDYLDLIAVREHGEIGPVLTLRHQNFTSLEDITSR